MSRISHFVGVLIRLVTEVNKFTFMIRSGKFICRNPQQPSNQSPLHFKPFPQETV